MSLMLHAGAKPVDYDALSQLPVPLATETHVPIAHTAVVDMVKYSRRCARSLREATA